MEHLGMSPHWQFWAGAFGRRHGPGRGRFAESDSAVDSAVS